MSVTAEPAVGARTLSRTMPVPASWISTPDGVAYPPAPWHLGASLHGSVWRVRRDEVPGGLPSGCRPVTLAGSAFVSACFVEYEPGGVLEYLELFLGVLVRSEEGIVITTPRIWVDSPESLAGGRAHWSVPKELARFEKRDERDALRLDARAEAGALASARFTAGGRLPGPSGYTMRYLMECDGRRQHIRQAIRGRVERARAEWSMPATGPFAFLAGRAPLMSIRIAHAGVIFGV